MYNGIILIIMQESHSVNEEGLPVIYKCVEDPVVRETIVMERPRSSPPVGEGSSIASKGLEKSTKLYSKNLGQNLNFCFLFEIYVHV